MEPDFIFIMIPYLAEVIAADMPDNVRSMRLQAMQTVLQYLRHYQKLGYMPKLLNAIAEKKCEFILSVTTKGEMDRVVRPRCLHYNGNQFIPDKYSVPEEELICWSETSLRAPLKEEAYKRYLELFKQTLPEESKHLLL